MSPIELAVRFWQAVGAFWAIVIIVVLVGGGTVLGLQQFGFFLDTQNANHQAAMANKNYNIQRNTIQFQQTFTDQTDKAYQQLTADKYNLTQDEQAGNHAMVAVDDNIIQSDINAFCKDAQKLTPTSLDNLGPGELRFYQQNC